MVRIFGTNGVRGIINQSMTVDMALDISRSAATILGAGHVAVARDSRMGGEMFSRAIVSGLLSTGCSVIDIGLAPTPTLQFVVPRLGCVGGIMITASHNPGEFSGIKVMGSDGIEVSRDVEDSIENSYFGREFRVAPWDRIGTVESYDSALRQFMDAIKSHIDVQGAQKRRLTVVVDCANSVGSLVTPQLMRELGCKVFSMNGQLDGTFPGRDPEPLPENLTELSRAVVSIGADIGIAHDGDADRATFVDERGQVLWGDQSFALIASRVLARKPGSTLVTPVSSGRLIEDVAKQTGAQIVWTEVGSVVVSHKVKELGADLGGEENGGVFYPPHQPVRDGPMTAAQVVDILAAEGVSLSGLIQKLPKYASAKTKVPVPAEKRDRILGVLLQMTEGQNRITLDGIKLIYDEGWILMRPSGTEPLWRCFAEGKTQKTADKLSQQGVNLIREAAASS
ncbi:MAG: phosphoglucosamine mutase [Candidatus Thorarchaeota archaeon]|nr:MAG: phosphoglucosamine mutase [Candidatus Thorarchaeota archaeon]